MRSQIMVESDDPFEVPIILVARLSHSCGFV